MKLFYFNCSTSQISRTVAMYTMYYLSCLSSFYGNLIYRLTMKFPPLMVYKVMQVNNDIDGYEECTDLYFKGQSIKSRSEQRIEYRVTWNTTKYRVINETPYYDMFLRRETKKTIIMAVLHNPVENVEENVTQRILKFAGPNHDFFGNNNIRMRWMFESDDLLDETVLVLLTSNGSLLRFKPNDMISIKCE